MAPNPPFINMLKDETVIWPFRSPYATGSTADKDIAPLADSLIPTAKGKVSCCYTVWPRRTVWNTEDSLEFFLIFPCSIVKVNRKP